MSDTERRGGKVWPSSYARSTRLWWVRLLLAGSGATLAVTSASHGATFVAIVLVALAILGAFVSGFSYAEWLRSQGKTSWSWGDRSSRRR